MERREFIHRSSGAAALGLAAASGLVPGQAAAQAGAGWNKTAFEAKSLADAVKALGGGTLMSVKAGANLSEVIKAINALGANPQDLVSILQAMKAAGALRAELEVI